MFEYVCVHPKEPEGTKFDLGLLAESLIFYGKVYLVIPANALPGLIQQIGPDLLLELISEGYFHILYMDKVIGALTKNTGTPFELYEMWIAHTDLMKLEINSQQAFISATGKSGKGRRLSRRFLQHVKIIEYPKEILKNIHWEMQEGVYIEEYIRRLIKRNQTSTFANLSQLKYRFIEIPGRGFQLKTNLNLSAMREAGINTSELEKPVSILAHYGKIVADMSIWAQLNSEVALTPRQTDVLSARVDKLLERCSVASINISSFQDFVFDDARAIREVINQGGREFRDIIPIIQRARKFRDWLSAHQPDTNLLKAYHKEVRTDTWIDRLPVKFARWFIFTGVGVGIELMGGGGVGIAGGVVLSVLDSFFLDKIVKGWKPNQFIEGPLTRFLEIKKS